LGTVFGGQKAHPVGDISDSVVIRVDLALLPKRSAVGGSGGSTPADGSTFIIRIDFAASPGLGKA
jgi:hypothetical protein